MTAKQCVGCGKTDCSYKPQPGCLTGCGCFLKAQINGNIPLVFVLIGGAGFLMAETGLGPEQCMNRTEAAGRMAKISSNGIWRLLVGEPPGHQKHLFTHPRAS